MAIAAMALLPPFASSGFPVVGVDRNVDFGARMGRPSMPLATGLSSYSPPLRCGRVGHRLEHLGHRLGRGPVAFTRRRPFP
jgi:hypothetical protein